MSQKTPDVRTSREHQHVNKIWGTEEWVVNNEMYCGKVLVIEQGHHTSMHFHPIKHETMYCIEGWFDIWFMNSDGERERRTLKKGDSIIIEPSMPHEIWGMMPRNVLIEFSTQHFDSDSYRVGKSG